jgi:selenocysteine lyase/cysteine desulfurase
MLLRERFPLLQEKVYLNSCSKGVLSQDVQQAYVNYLKDWNEKGSPWEYWVERQEAARHAFAGLINAEVRETAVTTSVSAAVSALATSLDFSGERNKIVATDFDFPGTAQVWHAQETRGAQVVHVASAGNVLPLERFAEAIDERTKLVSISHVCYRHGSMVDVPAIVEIAHKKGAWVMLDAYQSLGTMPIDVKKWKVDFLVGGVLKYLLGSSGLAYLYARKELLPQLNPLTTGWFAQDNIFAMDIYHHNPSATARKFESGTPPVPNVYAALAGIKLVQSVGLVAIERQIREITAAIKEGAMKRGFNLVSPIDPHKHGAMVSLRSHKVDLLVKWLEKDGVIVSSRDDNLRISPHFYNNLSDVNTLMDCLTKYKELLV